MQQTHNGLKLLVLLCFVTLCTLLSPPPAVPHPALCFLCASPETNPCALPVLDFAVALSLTLSALPTKHPAAHLGSVAEAQCINRRLKHQVPGGGSGQAGSWGRGIPCTCSLHVRAETKHLRHGRHGSEMPETWAETDGAKEKGAYGR